MTSSHAWRALGLDLVSLRIFVATAEEGSLAKAAAREHIAVSAVSRRISELEGRTGVQLFERRDRGVELTFAGEQLLDQVQGIFTLLERVALDLEALRGGIKGHVRIHAHMSASFSGLPRAVADFLRAHAGIDVEIEEVTSLEVLHAVRTGVADVGFVSGTIDPEGLQLLPWQSDRLLAVLPHDHALCEHEQLRLSDLLAHPFIGMQRDSALLALYRQQARAIGRELWVRIYASSFESVRSSVSAGLGLAILPARAATSPTEIPELVTRPLAESWAVRPLMMCVRDLDRLSAAARLFVQHSQTFADVDATS